ncbi:hypothetical protein [Paraburkholderia sediminicola]|uniref:hypothetical protein n=1 Tax=Paraburkholderia sediminicola TaxID=458836 RepID=UPI0038B6B404
MKSRRINHDVHSKSRGKEGLRGARSQYLEDQLRARQRALIVQLAAVEGWDEARLSSELQQAAKLDTSELGLLSLVLFRRFKEAGLTEPTVAQ